MASKKAALIPKNVKNPLFSTGIANFPVEEFTQGVVLVPPPKESEQLLTKGLGGEVDTFLGQDVTDLVLGQIPGSETAGESQQPLPGPTLLPPPPPTTLNFRAAPVRLAGGRPPEFIPHPLVKPQTESEPDFKQIPLDDSIPLYNPSAVLKSTNHQVTHELNRIVPPLEGGIPLYDPSRVGAVLPPHATKRPLPVRADHSPAPTPANLDPAFTSLSKHISTCSPSLVIDSGPPELVPSFDNSRKSSGSSSANELAAALPNSQDVRAPALHPSFSSPSFNPLSLTNTFKPSVLPSQSFHHSASIPNFFPPTANCVGATISSEPSQTHPTAQPISSIPFYSSAPSLANTVVPPLPLLSTVNSSSLSHLPSPEFPPSLPSAPPKGTQSPFRLYQPIPINTVTSLSVLPSTDFSPSAPPDPSAFLLPNSNLISTSTESPPGGNAPPVSDLPTFPAHTNSLLTDQTSPEQSVSLSSPPSNPPSHSEYSISSFFNQLNPFKIISSPSTNSEGNQYSSSSAPPEPSLPPPQSSSVTYSSPNTDLPPLPTSNLSPAFSSRPTSKSPSLSGNPLPPPPLSGFQTSSAPLSSLPNVHHGLSTNPYSINSRKKAPPTIFKPEHYFTPISEGDQSKEDSGSVNSDYVSDSVPLFPPSSSYPTAQHSSDSAPDQIPLVSQQLIINPALPASFVPPESSDKIGDQVPLFPAPSSSVVQEIVLSTSTPQLLIPSTSPSLSNTAISKPPFDSSDPLPPPPLSGFQSSKSPLSSRGFTEASSKLPAEGTLQQSIIKTEFVPLASSSSSDIFHSLTLPQKSSNSAQEQEPSLTQSSINLPVQAPFIPVQISDSELNQQQISHCSIESPIPLYSKDTASENQALKASPISSNNTQGSSPGTRSLFSTANPVVLQESAVPPSLPPQVPSFSFPPPPAVHQNQPDSGPPPSSSQPNSYRLSSLKKPAYAPVPDLDFSPRTNVMAYHQEAFSDVNQTVFHPPPIQSHSNSVDSTSSLSNIPPGYQPFTAMAVNQTYRPVYHHWFFRRGDDQKNVWLPFSMADSLNLEQQFASDVKSEGSSLVATDGGRYDVDVEERKRKAVYWHEVEGEVRRCSWFVKGPVDSRYQPYDENIAALLEEEYKTACSRNEWNRRVELADGEVIIIHSPNAIAHHQRSSSPDPWGNPPPMQEKPRVVKRGLDEFDIPEGEPMQVDHLLLLVHGIGKVCDLRFRSLVEVVDDFRNISVSLVGSHYKTAVERGKAGRIEVLPVEWHRALHTDVIDQRLADITLPSIPKARQFTNETLLDILFYTSPVFCEKIVQAVGAELNRVYSLYMERNPGYKGGVSLGGHSLGSLILFDMLCHQKPPHPKLQSTPSFSFDETDEDVSSLGCLKTRARLSRRMSYLTIGTAGTGQPYIVYPQLHFQPRAFFALGSPIGMFVTVRGIESLGEEFRFPTCPSFFNVFHPNDPVAYRIEGLINPEMAHHPAVLIPHHKGRKRMHLELKETMAHVTAAVKQKLVESVKNTWNTVYSLTRFNRLDPTVIENQVDKVIDDELLCKDDSNSSVGESTEGEGVELKVGQLNGGRRIDYVLQEAPLETFNQYISAVRSHLVYWESEDTMLLILKELYDAKGITADCQVPQPILPFELSPEANADPGTAYSHYTVSTTPPPSRQHTIAEEPL